MKFNDHESSVSSSFSGLHELHLSVLCHIMLRLDIETILRCRCVCKAWYDLISDPYFTNVYNKHPRPSIAIVSKKYPELYTDERLYFIESESDGDDVMCIQFKLNPRDSSNVRTNSGVCYNSFVGSCNGLLCAVVTLNDPTKDEEVWVMNPLTGESMKIMEVDDFGLFDNVIYGFGSTVAGDYYKVMRIVTSSDYEEKLDARILTIGVDDEWRDIGDPAIPLAIHSSRGVTLNGVVYFVSWDEVSSFVYAFDIGKEIGHRIPLPHDVYEENCCLSVLDDRLCLRNNTDHNLVDMWTIRQDGVSESWTRDFQIPRDCIPNKYFANFIPIATKKNGDLLLSVDQFLTSFDPKTKECVILEDISDDNEINIYFSRYIPSFCSLGDMITRKVSATDS